MWPELPIEFLVVGTPVSLQAKNSNAKLAWQALVLLAANEVLREAENYQQAAFWAFDERPRLSFTMFYFPAAPMHGDVDNIVKLTMDALIPRIYTDDAIIDRVLVQRFSARNAAVFLSPSPMLLRAMSIMEPVSYICIDKVSAVGVSK